MTRHETFVQPTEPICHRLFFGLLPPQDVVDRIDALTDGLGPAKTRVRSGHLHITASIFDDLPFLPPRLQEVATAAIASIQAPPMQLAFDRIVANGRTVCLVQSEVPPALKAFQRQLAAALERAQLPLRRGWKFHPHITLLYDPKEAHNAQIVPISWKAEEFVLIHSLVGLTQHVVLDRWPLIEQPRLL
jgi:2'-5' RNA ligase